MDIGDGGRGREKVGLVSREPRELVQRGCRAGGLPGQPVNRGARQLAHLGRGARVEPQDRRAQWLTGRIEADERLPLVGDAHGLERPGGDLGDHRRDGLAQGRPPISGLLLLATGQGRSLLDPRTTLGDRRARGIEGNRLARGRRGIDREDERCAGGSVSAQGRFTGVLGAAGPDNDAMGGRRGRPSRVHDDHAWSARAFAAGSSAPVAGPDRPCGAANGLRTVPRSDDHRRRRSEGDRRRRAAPPAHSDASAGSCRHEGLEERDDGRSRRAPREPHPWSRARPRRPARAGTTTGS